MLDNSDCFETECLPVENFLTLSGGLSDYLSNNEILSPYISSFLNIESFQNLIENRKLNPVNRQVLSKAMYQQNYGFQLHRKQSESLELIKSDITYCVTTAHQTNLFGGPLYFIQKAISTIKATQLAKKEYPNYFFIPIYWLGSEDHDFEELNHTWIHGQKLEWHDQQGGAFGRYSTESLSTILDETEKLLGNSDRAQYIIGLLRRAYEQKENIAKATRLLLYELLGEYGLLVVDGDDKALKELMIPSFEKELKEQFSFHASKKSADFLEKQYGNFQANAREINLFYLTENARERIIKMENGFRIEKSNRFYTEDEMIKELHQCPERFSPNVFLRPLMQEICLPNLLYVGGGGEISYWLQLKPIFDALNQPFPMLGLRDSAVYLPKKINKKIKQLHCSVSDFFQPKEQLIKEIVKKSSTHEIHLEQSRDAILSAMKAIEEKATAIDYTLQSSAKAEVKKMLNALSNLEKKMLRSEKKNHQTEIQRINAVYDTIYPKGSLQERIENFSQYYVNYGHSWINWMLENFNLFDRQVKVMKEE